MLSRSGFNIRKLIYNRRSRDDDWDSSEQDEISGLKAGSKQQRERGRSWIGGKQSPRKAPKPIVVVRKSQIVHRISSPLPPLPDTPYSSASSLCSCEYHVRGASPSPGLCPVRSKNSEGRSRSPHPRLRDDGRISPYYTTRRGRECHIPDPIKSTFDLLEALSLQPEELVAPKQLPTLELCTTDWKSSEHWSDNVQQLIKETDEAFRAVGAALAEAQLASEAFPDFERPRTPPAPTRTPPPVTPPRIVTEKQPNSIPLPMKSPRRVTPVPKPKRKRASQQRRKAHQSAAKSSTRWTLTDNVSELLSTRIFSRVEADEMLTPAQLQELTQSRIDQSRQKNSSETVRTVETAKTVGTDETDTPVDAFHLDDLPSRIGSSGVKLTVPSPVADSLSQPSSESATPATAQSGFSIPRKAIGPSKTGEPAAVKADSDSMTYQNISFPPPPSKNPLRFLPKRQLPPLPTIPEITATTTTITPETATASAQRPASPGADFIFLRSTPHTLTAPCFRHGPIRLAKADLAPEPRLALDDMFDWTAFQMAILGGAGDFFSAGGPSGFRWQQQQQGEGDAQVPVSGGDEAEDEEDSYAEDLAEWFAEFGFEHGGLIVPEPKTGAGKKARRSRSPPSLAYTVAAAATSAEDGAAPPVSSMDMTPRTALAATQSLSIPKAAELSSGSGSWYAEGSCGSGRSRSDGLAIRQWARERPRDLADHRASADSLPQSPMFNIVVGEGGGSDAAMTGDIVPMGYNLGHDLGDFLRWETEHVHASWYRESE
ncbi:hypothetical protein NKR23_g11471 [Pleurostoma richardsiae]|uniref:Uncharacterized protein n=1 Tax=Pleurostoma richardsiae TaxID=41990 RepID=A0AA38RA48_9PEZI|nr:hypothetical protein NKR23_g11471 [Pleurostoma richardsiae]